MARKLSVLPLLSVAALLFSSCATVINSPVQRIPVDSNPRGAQVFVNGKHRGKTPTKLTLSRWGGQTIRIEMPGYKTEEIKMTKSASGWVYGNILIGGVVGLVIDASTGSMFVLGPESIYSELEKGGNRNLRNRGVDMADYAANREQPAADQPLLIVMAEQVQPGWKKIGQLQPL